MKEFAVKDHEASLLPEGEWELCWHDEFDGTALDRSKWDYRMAMMGKNWPAWTDKGVTLDGNSHAVFTLTQNEKGDPVSSQLQTGYNFMDEPVPETQFGTDKIQWPIGPLHENLFLHSHGYYECRCRLQQKEGWWTAFWIQSPVIGSSLDTKDSGAEIDIMESFHPGRIVDHMVHGRGYGVNCRSLHTDKFENGEPRNEELDKTVFHRFGVLWDENGYTFYVDGVPDGHTEGNLSDRPEFILISTEVVGYRSAERRASQAAFDALGDTFVVDYVRVFDKK